MTTAISRADARLPFVDLYDREVAPSLTRFPNYVQTLKRQGIDEFRKVGFPTVRNEEWVYTSVTPITEQTYRTPRVHDTEITALISHHTFGKDWSALLVFVNGTFVPTLSAIGALPKGVRVLTLKEALDEKNAALEAHLGRYAVPQKSAFSALNAALFTDGTVVTIGRGVVLEKPVHILYVTSAPGEPVAVYPRNLFVLEENAQASIVENYSDLGEHVYFQNAVTEVVLGANAVCDHYRLGRESDNAFHVSWTEVHQARASSYTSHSIATGGALVRNDLSIVQAGEGVHSAMNGLFLAQASQHVDNHTVVDHAHPHGTSVEHYRGILDGRSRGVFNGKIIVRPGAIKTNAEQTNHNILLTDEALIDTKPELQIWNDDVKCAHGATVGQLDPATLFYVRTRGFSEKAARNLLTFAFASDVVSKLKIEPIRTRLSEYLAHRFSRELNLENAS